MKKIVLLLFILPFFIYGCRKTKNTEDPKSYVINMQGSYNWQGTQIDTNLSVPYNIDSGAINNAFPIVVLNDSTIICNPPHSFLFGLEDATGLKLDTFIYLSSSNTSKQIKFTANALLKVDSTTYDTIIYNYINKSIIFNEYVPVVKWYRTLHTP